MTIIVFYVLFKLDLNFRGRWKYMGKLKIVLLESNSSVRKTLNLTLPPKYKLYFENDAISGIKRIISVNPQFIILDLNISGLPGLQVLEKLKQIGVKAPIFILSSISDLKLKLAFYKLGAYDYILKPFSVGELKAKLNIVEQNLNILDINLELTRNFVLNKENLSVIRDNSKEISLRNIEFKILEYLYENAGQIVSRQKISQFIWENENIPWSNSIDVHIKYLRDKVDKPFQDKIISTVHGQGYRLELN